MRRAADNHADDAAVPVVSAGDRGCDEGGDPPCWAHLFDDENTDASDGDGEGQGTVVGARPVASPSESAIVADLGETDTRGGSGVIWSLPHGSDLDANLVHLNAGDAIDWHVNHEVDVVLSVIAGTGVLAVDRSEHELHGDVLARIPKGVRRRICAGDSSLTYLSIHRRRQPLAISPKPGSPHATI